MKQDRFLTGILIGVVVLVVAAVGLFIFRDGEQTYLDEHTPEAVVLNYVLALQSEDYERAYTYLPAEYQDQEKPSFNEFRSYFTYDQVVQVGIKITSIDVNTDQAWVQAETIQSSGGLLGGIYRSDGTAILIMDEYGEWKLVAMPYPFWGWEWFEGVKR